MFTALGAVAAGQALLADAVGRERNPAALAEDRSSTIKITKMRATRVGGAVFVKIDTNHGIVGWGEPVVEGRELLALHLGQRDPHVAVA